MRKILVFVFLACCWNVGVTQSGVAGQFVGTWALQAIQERTESGEWRQAERWGPSPLGIIMYDRAGNMAVQITPRDRSIPDPENAPTEIVSTYLAYFGTYYVDAAATTVTHHRVARSNTGSGDPDLVRFYEFEGDTLTLTLAPDRRARLIWRRQD